MGNRIKGLMVSFKNNLREEDYDKVRNAISLIKGVLDVVPIPSNSDDFIAESKVKSDIREKIFKLLDEL